MKTICGLDCCSQCELLNKACEGCERSKGKPCGGDCVAAQTILALGQEGYLKLKAELIEEINSLGITGLYVKDLNPLLGSYVNLAYPLPNGETVKLLSDNRVYLGNQLEEPETGRCLGVLASDKELIVCSYLEYGLDPELILYKKRL